MSVPYIACGLVWQGRVCTANATEEVLNLLICPACAQRIWDALRPKGERHADA